jgi:serine/threonine-protein kinase RIO1
MRNCRRLHAAGIPCPKPIAVRANVGDHPPALDLLRQESANINDFFFKTGICPAIFSIWQLFPLLQLLLASHTLLLLGEC